MRKTYGNTWWGKQWLNALTHIDYSNRLPRGRTYANKGLARNIQISGHRISADVQGTRPRPYKVSIEIPRFSDQDKRQILDRIVEQPLFLSQLLNRKLPQALFGLCEQEGIPLFPYSWNDIHGSCSCPDWAVPCKHLASVLYLLANEIDQDPFLVFHLHDFDLFAALSGLGYEIEEQRDAVIPLLMDLTETPSEGPSTFEWSPAVWEALDYTQIPDCQDQLLTVLGQEAVFFPEGSFSKALSEVLTKVKRGATRRLKKLPEEDSLALAEQLETVQLLVDEKLEFQSFSGFNYQGQQICTFTRIDKFMDWLHQIPLRSLDRLSLPLRGIVLTYRLSLHLATKGATILQLLENESGSYLVRWLPAYLNETVWEVTDWVETLTAPGLLRYEWAGEQRQAIPEDDFPALISVFIGHWINTFARESRLDLVMNKVLRMFFKGYPAVFTEFGTQQYPTAIALYLQRLFLREKEVVPVLQVVENEPDFGVQIGLERTNDSIGQMIELEELMQQEEYAPLRIDVLRDLAILAEFFPEIAELVAARGQKSLQFNSQGFVDILLRVIPIIGLLGIKVILPKSLQKLMRPRLSIQLEAGDDGAVARSGLIDLDSLLRFQWQVALGDQLVDPTVFGQMVLQYQGIVKFRDQYVYFEEEEVKKLVERLQAPPPVNGPQLLQAALTEEYDGAPVVLSQEAQALMKRLLSNEELPPPVELQAQLRPYQKRGFAWLYKNSRLGFGSIIADDMGLGKTIQVIATILLFKEKGALPGRKALVIVPTTLLTNWEKEIKKFAPSLKTHTFHGAKRSLQALEDTDVVLTTYGVARSSTAKLNQQDWLLVAIDEAQNIKNPSTAQTKAIKKIEAPIRLAMSGTPVENRLSEYWSIFDFVHHGYLGNLSQFKKEYAKPIELDRDHQQLERFRKITSPFILRRLKTDKSIIQDLPEKMEQDQFCELTEEQAALYQSVLDTTMESVADAEGINRQGLVLKLITALKQVCNHPYQFLKKGEKNPLVSGKVNLLLELVEQLLDNGEKALIFTQYREMGDLLSTFLAELHGHEVPFLHGGLSRKQRDALVEDFQHNRQTRLLILSLKAGGTGLNLTAASQVIHYDLWWNPAVETQATDRAFRIGQKRNVLVHRFITQGTFEEKINRLLQAKKELADLTVTSGEKWIGNLSNQELRDLIVLEK